MTLLPPLLIQLSFERGLLNSQPFSTTLTQFLAHLYTSSLITPIVPYTYTGAVAESSYDVEIYPNPRWWMWGLLGGMFFLPSFFQMMVRYCMGSGFCRGFTSGLLGRIRDWVGGLRDWVGGLRDWVGGSSSSSSPVPCAVATVSPILTPTPLAQAQAQAYYPGSTPFSYQNDSSSPISYLASPITYLASAIPYVASTSSYVPYHPQSFGDAVPGIGHSNNNNNNHSNNNIASGPSPNHTTRSALLVTQPHYPQSPAAMWYGAINTNTSTTTTQSASSSSATATSTLLAPSAPLLPPDMQY